MLASGGAERVERETSLNRLGKELSPYLLQHAGNPVDWYPWGEEAFEEARRRDCPVFLSIGYATCHWCHVMEHESFEDEEVARLMNRAMVCIKLDREERPDIDNVYMAVCQMLGGHCGWPLNVLLTPDAEPFFVATYVPPESRHGRMGMRELIPHVEQLWARNRDRISATAQEIGRGLRTYRPIDEDAAPAAERWIETAEEQLAGRYDAVNGGFGGAPKFPSLSNLLFLLRRWVQTGEEKAIRMVGHTLIRMREGGIYDHVGFGFHRYSTDSEWHLPHFEKMLYDQALAVWVYTEAFLATGEGAFRTTAREVAEYVLRDLADPSGGFRSAGDADSEGEEGRFYVWSVAELEAALGADSARVIEMMGARPGGNFNDEATGMPSRFNILSGCLPVSATTDTPVAGLDVEGLQALPEPLRLRLAEVRDRRPRPGPGGKVVRRPSTDRGGRAGGRVCPGRHGDSGRSPAPSLSVRSRRHRRHVGRLCLCHLGPFGASSVHPRAAIYPCRSSPDAPRR
jgi:uncharacterized protein YyaL (SSP411 family)